MRAPSTVERLLIEELDGEALVYDPSTHRAHCLDPIALSVLRGADGRRSPRALAAALGLPTATVRRTLDELASAGLLRRRIDRGRRRLVLAVAAAAPAVFTIVAPRVAQAASAIACVPATSCKKVGDCCGTPGGLARTCNGGLTCGSNGANSPCRDKTCS